MVTTRQRPLAWALLGVLLAGPALADGGAFTNRDPQLDALLEQAVLDEGRGDYERAARRYLEVEERLAQRASGPSSEAGSPLTEVGLGLDRGVRAYLADRVAALPPDAQGVYRATIDPRAREALRAALDAGDLEALEALVARWPQAGCVEEALRALAERAYERGELGRATRALRRLEGPARAGTDLAPGEVDRARRVALQRLLCALAAGERQAAEEALIDFEARGGDGVAEREVGGRRATLRSLVTRLPTRHGAEAVIPGFDPGGLSRTIPLALPELPPALRSPGASCPEPVRDPVAPLLYVADSKTVRAVSLQPGQRGWTFSFGDPDGEPSRLEAMVLRPALGPGVVLATLHRNRPARLLAPQVPAAPGQGPAPARVERQPDWCVVALDRRTGRLVWDSAAREPFAGWAREAEWLGPPLLHQGAVWVVALTRQTDLRAHLLRLDPATGQLRGATFLASRPGADPLGLGAPQAAPAVTPEGLIVVATGLGAVAAVEPALMEPAWVLRYPAVPEASLGALVLGQRRFRAQAPLAERSPLVVAPVDGVQVLALDGASGRPRWVAPRDGARWCAAGPEGTVLLLGRSLRALEREGGRARWVSVDLGAEALAPPLVLGEEALVVLPGALVRLSLASGAELGRWRFQDPAEAGPAALLGPGELGTVGADKIFVWRDQARAPRRELDPREQARADLPLGRVLARRGQEDEALVHLERAGRSRELDWTARYEARSEAWGLLAARAEAAAARGDEATFLAMGERALELAWGRGLAGGDPTEPDSPLLRDLRQRSAGLLLTWSQAQERRGGEGAAAAARGWRALLEVPEGTLAPLPGVAARVDARGIARLQLRALAERAPQALAAVEVVAQEALRSAQAAGSEDGLRRVVERFPWSARAADARWALARLHEARGRRREASDELQALVRDHPADPRRPEALARLTASLASQERLAAAREALEALLALQPSPPVSGSEGAPPVPARSWAEPLRARLLQGVSARARDEVRAAAGLEAPLLRVLRGPSELAQTGEALQVPPVGWGGAPDLVLLERAGRLRALRVPDGEEVLRLHGVPPARGGSAPTLLGGLLLVPMGERLEAWRVQGPEAGRKVWDATITPGDGPALGDRPVHELHPTAAGALVLSGRGDLLLLDGETGAVRWQRQLPLHPAGGVVVAGGRAVVFSAAPAQAVALELADGATAWSWPPAGTPPRARLSGPTLLSDEALACIEDGARVTALDLTNGQPRWSVTCEDAWVMELLPMPAGGGLLVRTQSWSGTELRVLDARTGRELWRDQGTGGQLPGQAAPGGPAAALNLTVAGEAGVYTVRTVGGEQELWSQNLATGQLQWRWQLPRGGPTPSALVETPTGLLVPRGGAFGGRTTLTLLARGTGEVVETHTVPGRRLVGAGAQARAGTLVLTTDRGLFGFARRDDRRLAEDGAATGLELARSPRDVTLRLRLARLLSTSSRAEEALGLLEEGILAEGMSEDEVGRLGQALAILGEDAADAHPLELSVRHLPRPPEIDGELDDWWRPWSGAELRRPRHVLPIQAEDGGAPGWAGTEDLSARLYLGWDARSFYFALDVDDSVLRPYDSEAERWLGDCLLIAIDCLGDGGEVVMNDDVLLSLALTLPRKKKDEDEQQEGEEDADRPQGTYFVRRKEDGSGAVYEAAIPWALFKEKGVALDLDRGPDAGLGFGLDLVLTDDDGERGREGEPGTRGARKSLQLTPGVLLHEEKSRLWQGYVPDRFARLRLERPGPGD